jgi:putative acetyltransferase
VDADKGNGAFSRIAPEMNFAEARPMNPAVTLRAYRTDDLAAVTQLYRETIHQVARGDYTQEEVDAWAPSDPDYGRWRQKLGKQTVVVAELDGEVVGFCSWDATGYLDFLYVHHAHQRQGIASMLYASAESALRGAARQRIHSQVSLTAQPFFLAQGFHVVEHQKVNVGGVDLPNAVMEKPLAPGDEPTNGKQG